MIEFAAIFGKSWVWVFGNSSHTSGCYVLLPIDVLIRDRSHGCVADFRASLSRANRGPRGPPRKKGFGPLER